jgi:hypothetical protein
MASNFRTLNSTPLHSTPLHSTPLTPWLAAVSHQLPALLTAILRLLRNRSCSSLCSLGTDRIENISPNSSYSHVAIARTAFQLLHCCVLRICCGHYLSTVVVYRKNYITTAVVYMLISRSLPSNGSTYHNILLFSPLNNNFDL